MDHSRLISDRARAIDASGIRKVFDLGATLTDPINLSIGQPDFEVPGPVQQAAIRAIQGNRNGYTPTQGVAALLARLMRHLAEDVGWDCSQGSDTGLIGTSGTSGALVLASLALLDPGDEIIIPDPYFVMYPHLATMAGARAVLCNTYPDLRMTAERVKPLITDRTKFVLFNSPSNPAGTVASVQECRDLLDLCRSRNVLLISDEIYDEFTYTESRTDRATHDDAPRCPSPCRVDGSHEHVLLIRGFGKTYGVTGWRMGYCAGPRAIIDQLAKLQQFTFVCPPSMAQWGCAAALDVDMTDHVSEYQARRDMVVERLRTVTDVPMPGGAFYAFAEVPEHLGMTGTQFATALIERSVLLIPGGVFSSRDTHVRISYATSRDQLERGLDIIAKMMR